MSLGSFVDGAIRTMTDVNQFKTTVTNAVDTITDAKKRKKCLNSPGDLATCANEIVNFQNTEHMTGSTGMNVYSIFTMICAVIAIYLVFTNKTELNLAWWHFLLACCCSPCYLAYFLLVLRPLLSKY